MTDRVDVEIIAISNHASVIRNCAFKVYLRQHKENALTNIFSKTVSGEKMKNQIEEYLTINVNRKTWMDASWDNFKKGVRRK